ncbi:MAG: glycosyltransferase [Thermoflexales bacterium]|nr:glycosyltransferase [Thermoflexales bacterium]
MRILSLSSWFPYPPDNGARIRLRHLLAALGAVHAVDLLCFFHGQEERVAPEVLPPGIVLLGALPAPTDWRRLSLGGLLSPYPRAVADQFVPEMANRLADALSPARYDLVLAFEIGPGVTTAPYLLEVRGARRVVEDLEISMIRAKARTARSPLARLRYGLTWQKQRRYTRELLREVDGCTVTSEPERRAVLDVAPDGKPVAVVPNGVDLEQYRGDFGPVEPDALVFPGALTYEANFEAMRFFLGEVFPRIRRARSQATLYITGRTDGVDLSCLPLGDGVVLTGYLPDVRPRVARSAVCIAPLTLGGGTRIKILEAMALGTPVVATSKGAEGLDVTPGRDLLIADGPEAFAAAVVRVLETPELRASLSAAGRRLVAERYDWRTIGQQLNAFLEQIYHQDTNLHR